MVWYTDEIISNSLLSCGGAVEGWDWLEKRGHYDHVLQHYLALALPYFPFAFCLACYEQLLHYSSHPTCCASEIVNWNKPCRNHFCHAFYHSDQKHSWHCWDIKTDMSLTLFHFYHCGCFEPNCSNSSECLLRRHTRILVRAFTK